MKLFLNQTNNISLEKEGQVNKINTFIKNLLNLNFIQYQASYLTI